MSDRDVEYEQRRELDQFNRRESDRRLDKIEQKLEIIAQSAITIARIEERVKTIESELDFHSNNQSKMNQKIDKIESELIETTSSVKLLHKILWLALTVGATVLATNLSAKFGI